MLASFFVCVLSFLFSFSLKQTKVLKGKNDRNLFTTTKRNGKGIMSTTIIISILAVLGVGTKQQREEQKQVEISYDDNIITLLCDGSNLMHKNEMKRVKTAVIDANESYIGNNDMAVMINVDNNKIYYILNHFKFEFLDQFSLFLRYILSIISVIIYASQQRWGIVSSLLFIVYFLHGVDLIAIIVTKKDIISIISTLAGVLVTKQQETTKQVVIPYHDDTILEIYDEAKLNDKNETTKARNVVIDGIESYNNNDYVAVMILVDILQIFDIFDEIEIEFIDGLLPLFVALTVIIIVLKNITKYF